MLLVHRDHVGRLGLRDQLADVVEDQPVVVAVEIVLVDEIGDAIPGGIVQQQPPEHRLFGLDGVRRHLEGIELGIGGRVHGAIIAALLGLQSGPLRQTTDKRQQKRQRLSSLPSSLAPAGYPIAARCSLRA
jgi:hypothetical protein